MRPVMLQINEYDDDDDDDDLSSQKRIFLVSSPDLDCGAEFFGDDLASYRNSCSDSYSDL